MANLFLNAYGFNLKPLYVAELHFFSNLTLFYGEIFHIRLLKLWAVM